MVFHRLVNNTSVAVSDGGDKRGYLVVYLPAFGHEVADFFHSVDHRGVVPSTELPRDGRVTQIGQLPENVHGNLASRNKGSAAASTHQLLITKSIQVAGLCEDQLWCYWQRGLVADQVSQDTDSQVSGTRLAVET